MRVYFRFLLFCMLALLGLTLPFSCQKSTTLSSLSSIAPANFHPLPARRLSTVTLPITVPTSVLEQQLNAQISGVLYQDDDMEADDLAVKVTKAGPLRLRAEHSKLYVEVPLRVWAKGRWQWNACEWCKKLQKTEETEFDMVVRTESRLQVMPDYTLKSYTNGDFAWGDRKPTLSLGPLRINLAPFIEPRLRGQLSPLLLQMDRELERRVNLKAYVQEAWQQLQQPLELSKDYGAWLAIDPQAIRITPLELQNNQLRLQIGIDAFLGVTSGQKPKTLVKPQLPNFSPARTLPQEASIEVATDVPYQQLTLLLRKEIQHKTFHFEEGKHQLTVHDLAVAGSGSQLRLELEVSGVAKSGFITKKFQGKVHLAGTPYFDAPTQSLKVRGLDFEVQTQDQLVNTADWLLHNKFRNQLEAQFTVPVKEQLASLRKSLSNGLTENRLHENVILRGSLLSFEPDTILVTPAGIRALFLASGRLAVAVQ
ncbi:DUF4403 family protein [Rufibacter roseus]|uniref:DUF4403 family protein n=1 Tax=Rufibacter roseus TaxID=1567108 RepID=A0ABW2DGS6_9BACT|nr:DUF4403 family protein [Rufibacter roseus]